MKITPKLDIRIILATKIGPVTIDKIRGDDFRKELKIDQPVWQKEEDANTSSDEKIGFDIPISKRQARTLNFLPVWGNLKSVKAAEKGR